VNATSSASRLDSLVCPLCEVGKLRPSDRDSVRCESCGGRLSGAMPRTLSQITALPDALGSHACEECSHPEMRRLPGGVFHCPACGSEVLPFDAPSASTRPEQHGAAYWAGWVDGRFGEGGSFVDNSNLVRWEDPFDRLAYYQGHRAGSEARREKGGRAPKARKGPTAFLLRRCNLI
jgi:ribosomal protein L37AE/L43A